MIKMSSVSKLAMALQIETNLTGLTTRTSCTRAVSVDDLCMITRYTIRLHQVLGHEKPAKSPRSRSFM